MKEIEKRKERLWDISSQGSIGVVEHWWNVWDDLGDWTLGFHPPFWLGI